MHGYRKCSSSEVVRQNGHTYVIALELTKVSTRNWHFVLFCSVLGINITCVVKTKASDCITPFWIFFSVLCIWEVFGCAWINNCESSVAGSKPRQACCLSRCHSTGSPVARVDSRTQESRREDAMVYPGSIQFDHYVQQLMILTLKSTQNLGVTIECKGRKFGRGG